MTYLPDWYAMLLLGIASWRLWHLAARDDITRAWRAWLVGWDVQRGYPRRPVVAEWLGCPYCAGWWIGIAWWIAWLVSAHWALVATAPFVISAITVAVSKAISADD